MKGWLIFLHSVRLVTGNIKPALQIALVPTVLALVFISGLVRWLLFQFDVGYQNNSYNPWYMPDPVSVLAAVLGFLGITIISLWVITSWHRFVLLGEYPQGWIPPLRFDRILAYFWRILFFGLIAIVAITPLGMVGVLFSFGSWQGELVQGVVLTIYVLAVGVFIYRFVAVLPAAAIGAPLTLAQSWQATRGATGTIILLLLLFIVVQLVLQFAAGLFAMAIPLVGTLLSLVLTAILGLIGVSILTTFYGHYIEGRELA